MIYKLFSLLMFMWGISFNVYALDFTENLTVKNIQIVGSASYVAVYTNAGDWQVGGCPGVVEVIIPKSNLLFNAMLSSTLTAKISNLQVRYYGTCVNGSDKMTATMMMLY